MRKLYAFVLVSVDGYYEGPGHDLTWFATDSEFDDYSLAQLREVGTILFGRVTYEMMANYWPQDTLEPLTAERMNHLPKVVFSRTLAQAGWENTRLVKSDAGEEIKRLKREPGGDIAIFGSGKLITSLAGSRVIDELRIIVVPVALGAGTPLFAGLAERAGFKLVSTRTFANGNVLLVYGNG